MMNPFRILAASILRCTSRAVIARNKVFQVKIKFLHRFFHTPKLCARHRKFFSFSLSPARLAVIVSQILFHL